MTYARHPYSAPGYAQIRNGAAPVPSRSILRLGSGLVATDNPATEETILSAAGGGGAPSMGGGRFTGDIYWDQATFGIDPNSPTATVTVGAAGKAIVSFAGNLRSGLSGVYGALTISASGANTIVPGAPAFPAVGTDPHYICCVQLGSNNVGCASTVAYLSGLTAGLTVFTLNFASSAACDWNNCSIAAIAI